MGVHRRNLLLSALAVLGMFTLLGMSCSITTQPYTGPPTAPKLYVGGDSITNEAIDDLNARFPSPLTRSASRDGVAVTVLSRLHE